MTYIVNDYMWTLRFITSGIPTKKSPLIVVIRVNSACPLIEQDDCVSMARESW